MDMVTAAVLCHPGSTLSHPGAGSALAPLVVSLPSQPHDSQHITTPAAATCASSTKAVAETPLKAKASQPVAAAAAVNGSSARMLLGAEAEVETKEVLLHRRLSLISLQGAPELTSVAEDDDAEEDGPSASTSTILWTPNVTKDAVATVPGKQQLMHSKLALEAIGVLKANDLGGYTIPATGLYPYQWNWDSALVAMGWSAVDEARAWEELEKLFSAQWEDGMVPHIVFHKASPTYFPGPEIWGYEDRPMKSTGITQPPIAATAVRRILENQLGCGASVKSGETGDDWDMRPMFVTALEGGSDLETSSTCSTSYCRSPPNGVTDDEGLDSECWARAAEMFPKLMSYHRWFYSARDPEKSGVVATLHPWESGMDNSPAWDVPLANVPVDDIPPYTRRDLGHVDAAMRPHKAEYDRYLTLLYRFRKVDYDPAQLYWLSPFRVTDICTNSLLHRANLDLRWLAISLNRLDCVAEIDSWLVKSSAAFDSLWDDATGIYRSKDQLTGKFLDSATSGGFLPLFARVASPAQAARLASTLESWLDAVQYGVPSLDPRDPKFEGLRYWRGPVWAIVNYMIVDGLRFYGYSDLADRVENDTMELIQKSGLYEYYDPVTGQGAGGNNFSWTAAMVLSWLDKGGAESFSDIGATSGAQGGVAVAGAASSP